AARSANRSARNSPNGSPMPKPSSPKWGRWWRSTSTMALRAQIHKDGGQVTIFSRNLEDQSHMFPELIAGTLKQVRAERAILDAETLAYNATSEEFLPFQETTRRRRKHGIEAMAEQIPLKAFVFDILYKDGMSLLDTPLSERLQILAETLRPADDILMLTASQTMSDAHALTL